MGRNAEPERRFGALVRDDARRRARAPVTSAARAAPARAGPAP